MSHIDQRAALERLIEERREDYASLSRLIGRNPAYIQQFIKRGVPRRLAEEDRRTLARYFGVGEDVLGGRASPAPPADGKMVAVPRLDVGASAGAGALAGEERPRGHIAFDPHWLRFLARGSAADLSLINVRGDSMAPTLVDGDDILVNGSEAAKRLTDEIFVIRREDSLLVKRVALSPAARRATIKSDNPAYPSWPDVDLAEIDIIGRVIWAGRKLG